MATTPISQTSRRGILGLLAVLPALGVPTTSALANIPPLSAMISGGTWRECVAEYHAAAKNKAEVEARFADVDARCKAVHGKIVVPVSFRTPFARSLGWWDMSISDLRADMTARRGGGSSPELIAKVDKDLEGVAEFQAARANAMAPRNAAWEELNAAERRWNEAEDALRNFPVRSIAELAEKAGIARDEDSEWIMGGIHADLLRFAV